jgi:hypothetical protein
MLMAFGGAKEGLCVQCRISIRLRFRREAALFYIINILTDGAGYLLVQGSGTASGTGLEFRVDPEHVVHHQHLSVAMTSGADADGRDDQAFGNFFCQGGGNLFQHQRKTAGILQQFASRLA